MTAEQRFTTTSLLAAASGVLEQNGYRQVRGYVTGELATAGARVYEDPYSIAALVAYETWGDLAASWTEAQAGLVELISAHFSRDDAKAWEGYLVLLTPSVVPREDQAAAVDISRNTAHVRKLLATAEDLQQLADIERALLPLLPLSSEVSVMEERSALDLLPSLLGRQGISENSVRVVIDAFVEQEPILENLHSALQEE